MKKIFIALITVAIVVTTFFGSLISISAQEVDLTPNFEDNFNSYTTGGYIEDNTEFTKVWYNELIDNMLGNSEAAPDTECKEVGKIIDDPTIGAAAGNKVLHLQNYKTTGSFFYVSPRNLKVKDFELSFKVYNLRSTQEPWFGISARKETNVRFNGTNNMLLTMKVSEDKTTTPSRENLSYVPFRGYGGAGAPQEKTKDLDNYDSENKVSNAILSNFVNSEYTPANNTMSTWYTVKYTVTSKDTGGSIYKTEVITADGVTHYIGALEYKSTSVDKHGFISLNACISDIYIDDFKLVNLDTEPAPVEEIIDVTGVTLDNSTLELKVEEEKSLIATVNPDDADDKSITWTSSDESVATVSNGKVKALKAGTATITVTTNDGNFTATCAVTVTAKTDDKETPKKGCGSSVAAAGIAAMILSLTAVVYIIKK